MTFVGIVFFGNMTWIAVGLCSFLFPVADSLESSMVSSSLGLVISAVGMLAYFPWQFPLPRMKPRKRASISTFSIPISLVVQITLLMIGTLVVHRDFMVLAFQALCLHYIILLEIIPHFSSRFFFQHGERLYSFTKGIIAFFLGWILLMGYAIAVRSEPRWIPAIAYNVINLGLCFFLYVTNLGLHKRSKRELIVTRSKFLIEHLDITTLFNPVMLPIVRSFFLSKGTRRLTCREVQTMLGRGIDLCDCSKATLCTRYKYSYNRIHELKRIFSALRLGIIIDPQNRRDILSNGWTFRADPSINVIEVEDSSE